MPTLLQNAAQFKVLTPPHILRLQLRLIEQAGRTCYQSEAGVISIESSHRFISMLLKRGHLSVLEHAIMVVQFSLCSRGMTHEQVRHRLTGISQESTRYVDESDLRAVVPPFYNTGSEEYEEFAEAFTDAETHYRNLRNMGVPPEDARQVLPIGTVSQIVVSANYREWRHIFKMRCAKQAHWEIRSVMTKLLEAIKLGCSPVFDDFEYGGKHRGIPYYTWKYEA